MIKVDREGIQHTENDIKFVSDLIKTGEDIDLRGCIVTHEISEMLNEYVCKGHTVLTDDLFFNVKSRQEVVSQWSTYILTHDITNSGSNVAVNEYRASNKNKQVNFLNIKDIPQENFEIEIRSWSSDNRYIDMILDAALYVLYNNRDANITFSDDMLQKLIDRVISNYRFVLDSFFEETYFHGEPNICRCTFKELLNHHKYLKDQGKLRTPYTDSMYWLRKFVKDEKLIPGWIIDGNPRKGKNLDEAIKTFEAGGWSKEVVDAYKQSFLIQQRYATELTNSLTLLRNEYKNRPKTISDCMQ